MEIALEAVSENVGAPLVRDVIEGTAESVPISALDSQGRYGPPAA